MEYSSNSPYAGSVAEPATRAATRFIQGFVISSLVFCVGPLTILGSIDEGLGKGADQLLLKAALDGFASIAFAAAYGWGVGASVVVLVVVQGSLTALGAALGSFVPDAHLSALTATGGLLLVGVALRLLEIKQVKVADLLPALVGGAAAHRAGRAAQVAGSPLGRALVPPATDGPCCTTPSATSRIESRRSIAVFWIQRNASGSESPEALLQDALGPVDLLARLEAVAEVRDLRLELAQLGEPAQCHLDRGHQVGLVERLDQVGHRPRVARPLDQLALAEGGQDHHRGDPRARRSAPRRRSRRGEAS